MVRRDRQRADGGATLLRVRLPLSEDQVLYHILHLLAADVLAAQGELRRTSLMQQKNEHHGRKQQGAIARRKATSFEQLGFYARSDSFVAKILP